MSKLTELLNLVEQSIVPPTGTLLYTNILNPIAPEGYVQTGKAYSKSTYPALYSVVGLPNATACRFSIIPTRAVTFKSVGFGNGYFLSMARTVTGEIVVSENSYDWLVNTSFSNSDIYASTNTLTYIYDIIYSEGNFIAAGTMSGSTAVGQIIYTSDVTGSSGWKLWAGSPVGSSPYYRSIIYANGLYVAAGTSGIIYTSPSITTTLVSRTSGTTSTINGLTYGNSLYVYGGGGGVLATSTDAITWTARTSGTVSAINGITYGNSIFVIAGAGGMLRTSTDAITWTTRTSGTVSVINIVKYLNNLFVYAGVGGVLATSTDAITWTARVSTTTSSITGIAYGNGVYALCASDVGGSKDFITPIYSRFCNIEVEFYVPKYSVAPNSNSNMPSIVYIKT